MKYWPGTRKTGTARNITEHYSVNTNGIVFLKPKADQTLSLVGRLFGNIASIERDNLGPKMFIWLKLAYKLSFHLRVFPILSTITTKSLVHRNTHSWKLSLI